MTLLRGWAGPSVVLTPRPRASGLEKTQWDYRSKLDTGEVEQRNNRLPEPTMANFRARGGSPLGQALHEVPWEEVTRPTSLWPSGLPSLASEGTDCHLGKQRPQPLSWDVGCWPLYGPTPEAVRWL